MEAQRPTPDPALRQLDRFVGTWEMSGRTLDSDVDNVTGRTTFEWLPGGFFLQQRIELDFAGFQIPGLELIGYDPRAARIPRPSSRAWQGPRSRTSGSSTATS